MPTTSRYPATRDGLTAALAALGTTPAAVADTLTASGDYLGRRESAWRCPLALYLVDVLGLSVDDVAVFGDAVEITVTDGTVSVDLPDAACAFVTDYDSGAYPDLADEPDLTDLFTDV